MPRPINILLLEDDEGDAKAVRRAFQKARIPNSIDRAVDGYEGLSLLNEKTSAVMPDILLVDLNMPRMDGIQFVRALRADERLRRSIVFILTTSHRDEDKIAAYDLNVAGYIGKGRAAADFLSLANLIELYVSLVELPGW